MLYKEPLQPLKQREQLVLDLLATGHDYESAAKEINRSAFTVKRIMVGIFDKYETKKLHQVIAWYWMQRTMKNAPQG